MTRTEPAWTLMPSDCEADSGAMNAKDEPRYEGRRLRVMRRKRMVEIPENNSVVFTGKPVSVGTSSVAPNMATTCCMPMPIVRPQLKRSSGATTAPGAIF